MTVTYAVAGEVVSNTANLSGTPAVSLLAANIVFTNTERGRVTSTTSSTAALVIAGEGVRVVNEQGGVISAVPFGLAIAGSSFADSIDNSGTVIGSIQLGGGNDSYIERKNPYGLNLDLGADNDRFEAIGKNFDTFYNLKVDGGTGDDTLVLSGSIGQLLGGQIVNFEHLVLGPYAENLDGLSGFRSVIVTGNPDPAQYSSVGLLNSLNPGTDIVFAGSNNLRISGNSRFANVIGSTGIDSVEISSSSSGAPVLSGAVLLGDGSDTFRLSQYPGGGISVFGRVDAGTGFDVFEFSLLGGVTFDASVLTGFDYFNGGGWTSNTTNARITGLNGYYGGQTDGDGGTLTVADSSSPDGSIFSLGGGTLVFEATTVFGRYGQVYYVGFGNDLTNIDQVDLRQSVTFINNGRIIGNVELGIGDDVYDGRLGSAGGRIFGYAGNDVLRAGVADSWIDGGFGADDLYGNAGNDTLIGGGGGDILSGGGGADTLSGGAGIDNFRGTAAELSGDTITDLAVGERITFMGASLGGSSPFGFSRGGSSLTFTGGSLALQNLPANARFAASNNTLGAVDLTLQANLVRGDANGDGRSDILWRNANGQLSSWQGTANGRLADNGGVVNQFVSLAWKIAGTDDFNGDGRADILWRNDNGQISQWLGTAGGGYADNGAVFSPFVPLAWKIAGTGDFNGDGRADVVWRNANGQLSQWLGTASGALADNGAVVNQFVPTSWKIAGSGDFNGDGYSDVIWRNDNGLFSEWLSSASGRLIDNGTLATQNVPTAWKIQGTGDFNGDGRSDVLWRNDNGQLSQWLGTANGTFFDNGAVVGQFVPNAWKIAGTGDFNGDGFADIAWRNVSGQLSEWLGTASGGFIDNGANVNQFVPNAWQIQSFETLLI